MFLRNSTLDKLADLSENHIIYIINQAHLLYDWNKFIRI